MSAAGAPVARPRERRGLLGPRAGGWGSLVLLGIYAAVPLLVMLVYAARHDLAFAGAEGPFPGDQYQYMAWIREYGSHLLASNLLDIAPSGHVFFHPMFFLSGVLLRLGVPVGWTFLVWKPVAVVVLFVGFRSYVRRFLDGPWERVAALALALFYAVPALEHYVIDAASSGPDKTAVSSAGGEILPAAPTSAYLPAAIAMGLMPLFLLGVERIAAACERGERPAVRTVVVVSAYGALAAWLHPWQGEILLLVAGAGLALTALRGGARRYALCAVPLAATAAPVLYYFVLSRSDPAWRLAQTVNATVGRFNWWVVAIALLPLAAVAAAGVRRIPDALGERMVLLWPPAAAAVYIVLSPSFPQHALEGITLPLAVLAVRGARRLRLPAAVAAGLLAVAVIPAFVSLADLMRHPALTVGEPRFFKHDETDALSYLRDAGAPGGVLTRLYLGGVLPAATGRQTWVAHPSWTPDFSTRSSEAEALFAGTLKPAQAALLVKRSGARYVLADCAASPGARAQIATLAASARRFGCATVYLLRPPPSMRQRASVRTVRSPSRAVSFLPSSRLRAR